MKRSLVILSLFVAISSLARAQATDSTQPSAPRTGGYQDAGGSQAGGTRKQLSPTKRAAHQLSVLQEKLNLTQDQVSQVNMILLNRETSLDSLKNHPSGDRKSDIRSRRQLARGSDQQINALLTDDQKKLYQQWKDTQKMERLEKRNGITP